MTFTPALREVQSAAGAYANGAEPQRARRIHDAIAALLAIVPLNTPFVYRLRPLQSVLRRLLLLLWGASFPRMRDESSRAVRSLSFSGSNSFKAHLANEFSSSLCRQRVRCEAIRRAGFLPG